MNDELDVTELHSEPNQKLAEASAERPHAPLFPVLLGAAVALAGFACFAYPMFVIRPFRQQGARELAVALALRFLTSYRDSPAGTPASKASNG